MLIVNNEVGLARPEGHDGYGQPAFGPLVRVPCAIVSLAMTVAKTSVRNDTSATKSNAEEIQANAKILFPVEIGVTKECRVVARGHELRIVDVQPRFDVAGEHDHDECLLTIWRVAP